MLVALTPEATSRHCCCTGSQRMASGGTSSAPSGPAVVTFHPARSGITLPVYGCRKTAGSDRSVPIWLLYASLNPITGFHDPW